MPSLLVQCILILCRVTLLESALPPRRVATSPFQRSAPSTPPSQSHQPQHLGSTSHLPRAANGTSGVSAVAPAMEVAPVLSPADALWQLADG